MAGEVWIGRLLGAGSACAAVGASVWILYLKLRPACLSGFVRLIDVSGLVLALLLFALVVQSLAWWRWRVSHLAALSAALAVTGLLALVPTVLLTLYGIAVSVTTLGRQYDPGCWSF